MQRKLHQGKLINWKDDRGFGFIQDKNSREQIFIHISELKDSTRRPEPGDTIFSIPPLTKNAAKPKPYKPSSPATETDRQTPANQANHSSRSASKTPPPSSPNYPSS
jgi:cold shock CspA family protein